MAVNTAVTPENCAPRPKPRLLNRTQATGVTNEKGFIMNMIRLRALLAATAALMSLASPVAHAGVIVTSATYGVNQTKAPGMASAKCFQRPNINLKDAVNNYCSAQSVEGICLYKVPSPSASVDPGIGCYKSFDVTYRCAGSSVVKQKTIGGYTDEAANQVVEFDCSPAATQIGLPLLQSNGNPVTAGYSVAPSKIGQPNSNGKVLITPLVSRKSLMDQDYNPAENTLTCSSSPYLVITPTGNGAVSVEYQVIGYRNVTQNLSAANEQEVTTANVDFSLKVNGAPCNGSFSYFRDRHNPVEANFFLMVNGFQIPLNIAFQAPLNSSSRLLNTSPSSMLAASRFRDVIIGSRRPPTGLFRYDLVYQNQYGLLEGKSITCAFGDSGQGLVTTDASTGRARIEGIFTIANAGPDSNQIATWTVTTSLTGSTPVFRLRSGRNIGAVTCKPSGDTSAVYTYDLGTW